MLKTRSTGFTIVELLIVIVVIAILAAISIVAYNGIQARANDSKTKTVVNQVEKAINILAIDTGRQPLSGYQSTGAVSNGVCPGSTLAGGWAGRPSYNCTLEDLLIANNAITSGVFASLPQNKTYSNAGRTLMFYNCTSISNAYTLLFYLESPDAGDVASFNNAMTACGVSVATRDAYVSYGMKAARVIKL